MVYDLFSKRRRLERGEAPDVYIYDVLSSQLRVQITYLFDSVFSRIEYFSSKKPYVYHNVVDILREERGTYSLANGKRYSQHGDPIWDYETEIKQYFLKEEDAESALDVIELFFRFSKIVLERDYSTASNLAIMNDIVNRVNVRFREHGLGYAFEENSIIRVDSELIHSEIVKPALKLLHNVVYKNAEEEYLSAHEHYRHGRFRECIAGCLKSLESTIKIIGEKRRWALRANDTASRLIEAVMSNKLIPDYFQAHFGALRSCLESGVPTVRNKVGGHGQGATAIPVPPYLAEYLLGETATAIRLLVEADRATP